MKVRSVFLVVLAIVVAPVTAMGAVHIASVDYQRLLKEAPQVKASQQIVKREYEPRKKALDEQHKVTQDSIKNYRNLGPGTNELARASAFEKVKNSRNKLQKMARQYKAGVRLRETQLRESFKDALESEVRQYAERHGYVIVLKRGVVYAGSSVDITDQILALLKRDYRRAQESAHKKGQHE